MNGKPLEFEFFGLYNGVVTMYDRGTESVWLQVGGRAIRGSMVGTVLKSAPLTDTTWKKWKQLYPDTLVMSPDTPFVKNYTPRGDKLYRGTKKGFPQRYFRTSLVQGDARMSPWDMVLGVIINDPMAPKDKPKAYYHCYPLNALKAAGGVLQETLHGQDIVAFYDEENDSATAYSRKVEGKILTFSVKKEDDGSIHYTDKETGSLWDFEGRALSGSLKGRSLTRMEGHLSEWYGWAAYFANTTIYGRDDAPKTLDLLLPEAGGKKPDESKPGDAKPEPPKNP